MSTTTSHFQTKPDYYGSIEECIESSKNKEQTNVRYRNFIQTHFTAGDEEQFEHYRYDKNPENIYNEISLEKNIFKQYNFEYWNKYEDIDATNVIKTFHYLFYKFKKGIFVKIADGELKVFLPFSNINFVNEWSEYIKIDPKYGSLYDFIKYTNEMEGRTYNKNNINEFINTWYGNNCLVRYEYPIKESDTNISNIKDMLIEVCKNRQVPNIEFFINRRDFPLITKNGTEPYYHIWNTMEKPLISHNYDKYVPILSMCKTDYFADVLIPTHEDWARIGLDENKIFPKCHINSKSIFNDCWESKKSTAVFRGSSTGYGVDVDTNQRLKVVFISNSNENNDSYIDAGITKWNTRPRKYMNNPYLQTIEIDKLPFGLSQPLTPYEQSNYKYIIHIDGHVSAFRLSYELNMNSVVLIVKTDWKIWYSDLLKPYVHYIPIKEDLSDLIDIIKWCRNNDDKCKQISNNAKEFYNKYLNKNGIFDYIQKTLVDLKHKCGTYFYNIEKPLDIQVKHEYKYIKKKFFDLPLTNKKINNNSLLPCIGRNYTLLKGINYTLNSFKNFFNLASFEEEIFNNKLGTINKYELFGFKFTVKKTTDFSKINEHIHETFIGNNCINEILRYIPNFVFNFKLINNKGEYNIINEYIEGQTFKDYISSENFIFEEYVFIILQICLALHTSQKMFCFVHNDLTPWNIIIQRTKTPVEIDYIINHKKVLRVKTQVIPIIIDYGKSHVIYKNTHYGYINMFKTSSVTDILTLLITSIYQILMERMLSSQDFNYLLKIANFITNTTYCKKNFTNSKELKHFLHNAKKYSNLISENKFELELKTPMDLYNYIRKNLKYKFQIEKVDEYNCFMTKGDSKQIFDYILSQNSNERLETYLNYFNKIKNNELVPKNSDLISTYYIAQNIYNDISNLITQMNKYLYNEKIDNKEYNDMANLSLEYIKTYLNEKIKKNKFVTIFSKNFLNINIENYDKEIFLTPYKVKNLINKYEYNDISEYKYMTEFVLNNSGIFKVNDKDRNYILKNVSNILEIDTVKLKTYNANNYTIRKYAKKIYSKNIKEINIKDENDIKSYKEILSLI